MKQHVDAFLLRPKPPGPILPPFLRPRGELGIRLAILLKAIGTAALFFWRYVSRGTQRTRLSSLTVSQTCFTGFPVLT